MSPVQIETPVSPPPAPSASDDGQNLLPALPVSPKKQRRWWLWGAIALLVVIVATAGIRNAAKPKPAPAAVSQALTAHGTVQPIARASVATMTGGVVDQLPVQVGQTVDAQQVLARVAQPTSTELLVSPWQGTVTGINVHKGDTVMPGTVVVTVADVSRYQIETTDVDEYLIGYVKQSEPVTMTVEALDQVTLRGFVRTVALQQQTTSSGSNYPVVIDLAAANPELRPGMTVRITFL